MSAKAATSQRRTFALLLSLSLLFHGATALGSIIYVADSNNGVIDKVTSSGMVSTFATGIPHPYSCDVAPDGALFVGGVGGRYYYLPGIIYKVTPDGAVFVFATVQSDPGAITHDASGTLYVANGYARTISKVGTNGVVSQFASIPDEPTGLAFDSIGNLFVATLNTGIYEVNRNGVVSLFHSRVFSTGASGLAIDARQQPLPK